MGVGQGRLKVVAELLVKLGVLLGRDVFLGPGPDGIRLIDGLPAPGLDHGTRLAAAFFVAGVDQLAVFPLFFFHQDRQADVVGVLADDAFEFPGAGIVQCVFHQVQGDAGAAGGALNRLNLEVSRAAAHPAHAFADRQTSTARLHCDFVSHDKTRVKTHTKLADQLRIGFLVAREFGDKIFGSALGNRAEVVDRLLLAHTDTVVGDGEGFGVFVKTHPHLEAGRVFVQGAVIDGFKTQLVAGIRRVGYQFA